MTHDTWPLTAAQRGIWLGQALAPESPGYWTAEVIELRGYVDLAALQAAVDETLHTTDALHMRYSVAKGEPVQALSNERPPSSERLALSHDAFEAWCRADLQTLPRLDRSLYRSVIVELGGERCLWYLRAHHIALDGYGHHLVQRRVVARYRARVSGGSAAEGAPRLSLRDVSAYDLAYRTSAAFEADRAYWLTQLADCSDGDGVRASQNPVRGAARVDGALSEVALKRVSALSRSLHVDPSAVLLAALARWLHERTGRGRLRLGLAIAGRLGTGSERLPCMAMNVLGVPAVVQDQPFAALARCMATQLRAGLPHQRYRYEDVRLDLQRARDRAPLFDCVLNWIPFAGLGEVPGASLERRTLASGPVEGWAVALVPDQRRLTLEADAGRFSPSALAEHHAAFARVVEQVADGSIDQPLAAPPRPRSWLVGEPAPRATDIVEMIAAIAARTPARPAVEHLGRTVAYRELWQRVQSAASALLARGMPPAARVAVLLPRSPEVVVAQLAVLLAGGTYVPMDPSAPVERNRFVLDDAAPWLVVHDGSSSAPRGARSVSVATLIDHPNANRFPRATPEAGAYVIYTSGSTGTPRGVEVSRHALASFSAAARQRYAMTSDDRVLQFAALQFDASVEEIYVTLTAGATLVLRSDDILESFHAMHDAVHALRLTVLDLPTAYFHALLAAPPRAHQPASALRLVIIGGEAASADAARTFPDVFGVHAALLNTYGPTEATVVCSACELTPAMSRAPIGLPLPGVTLAVLDQARSVVPQGTVGQLAILGVTLATGYHGRPMETSERFVSLTVDGVAARAYLTGDLARVDDEGQLCFVGRVDDELKISGQRVHPREVEAALTALDGVTEAAVLAASRGGSHALVAFVCGAARPTSELQAQLRARLLPQAIPSSIIARSELPRDSNGKVDRKRLRDELGTHLAAPSPQNDGMLSRRARIVVEILRELLSDPRLTADDDFFDAGGHSLLALRAVDRLSSELGVSLAVSTLFEHRTARALADHALVDGSCLAPQGERDFLAPVLLLQGGAGPALFCVHPVDGAAWCYAGLAPHLPGVKLVGLQSEGLRGDAPASFAAATEQMIDRILDVQANGPYHLLGWSAGGGLAHAVACGLLARGHTVSLLVMLDSHPGDAFSDKPEPTEEDALISMLDEDDAAAAIARSATRDELVAMHCAPGSSLAGFAPEAILHMARSALSAMRSYRAAQHPRWPTDLLYFRATVRAPGDPDYRRWRAHVAGKIEVVDVPCRHLAMCSAVALEAASRVLRPRLS